MLTYYDRNFEAVFVATPSEARVENAAANRALSEERHEMALRRDWCNTFSREEHSPFGPKLGVVPNSIDRTTICDVDKYHIQR
ncbi:hypothetical protein PHABIO_302 [Pseudomonas phage Phabio]|uniref:Uncharacterized protein n=1 Tax=Pseudomonas phage Phabio TaxID=2006668 RepID=A0A1Y0SYU3_9CAUD|nr:hypothetical protein MZD05_gp302 [Pseudomonas phage Phabio]ARV76933.1 hypothetical protein PHABIO_302 [Pseudomonas phage Phabio]